MWFNAEGRKVQDVQVEEMRSARRRESRAALHSALDHGQTSLRRSSDLGRSGLVAQARGLRSCPIDRALKLAHGACTAFERRGKSKRRRARRGWAVDLGYRRGPRVPRKLTESEREGSAG